MSVWSRLGRALRGRPAPETPDPLPAGKGRIHLLAGDFRDEATARAYAYDTQGDGPEQLTVDQPGAFIDTDQVEVDFGDHVARLNDIFQPAKAKTLLDEIDGQNTLIIIAEPAFGGQPYRLADTDVLTYMGAEVVDI